MVEIEYDISKSIEENAGVYFDKVKKLKKKVAGAMETIERTKKQLEKEEKKAAKAEAEAEEVIIRKKEWYEKFRWFKTSEGFLVIGGRDATSNEIVVKKHTEPGDLVFHTDMAGSPFFVIKKETGKVDGKPIPIGEASISEVADATATFSRAWKGGLGNASVFYVNPDQVTKEAQAGEFVPKGAFMIKGKTNYVDNKINLAIGNHDGALMAGPVTAVSTHCEKVVKIIQGEDKASVIAKRIKAKIGGIIDDIIRVLPSGNYKISKR